MNKELYDNLQDGIDESLSKIKELETGQSNIGEGLTEISETLSNLSNTLKETQQDIGELSSDLNKLAQDMSGVSGSVGGVNSSSDVPLNHLIWLNDYKTYGQDSYVFNNKDILYELYRSPIAPFDMDIRVEAFNFANENNELSSFLSRLHGLEDLGLDIVTNTNVLYSNYELTKACLSNDVYRELFMSTVTLSDVKTILRSVELDDTKITNLFSIDGIQSKFKSFASYIQMTRNSVTLGNQVFLFNSTVIDANYCNFTLSGLSGDTTSKTYSGGFIFNKFAYPCVVNAYYSGAGIYYIPF